MARPRKNLTPTEDEKTQAALDKKFQEATAGDGENQEEELFPGADKQAEEEMRLNAILEAKAAQAANKVLASLPDVIDKRIESVRTELQGQLTDAINQLKQAIITGRSEAQDTTTANLGAPSPSNPGQAPAVGGSQLENLSTIASAIVSLMGGNKPAGGGIKEALGQIIEFQDMAAALWQQPFESAMRTLVTTLKGGYSVGKSTEELTEGLERAAAQQKSAIDIFKVGSGGNGSKPA